MRKNIPVVIVMVSALGMTGCSQPVDSWELVMAANRCGGVENIHRIWTGSAGAGSNGKAICKDGGLFILDRYYRGVTNAAN